MIPNLSHLCHHLQSQPTPPLPKKEKKKSSMCAPIINLD